MIEAAAASAFAKANEITRTPIVVVA